MDKIVEVMAHDSNIISLQYLPVNEQCMLPNDRDYSDLIQVV